MVDSIQESCHCNDSAVCITSVMCIDEMLGSLEQISKGVGINDTTCDSVNKYYRYLNKGMYLIYVQCQHIQFSCVVIITNPVLILQH